MIFPSCGFLLSQSTDARRLFVRQLSFETTTDSLTQVFSEFGAIEEYASPVLAGVDRVCVFTHLLMFGAARFVTP